MKIFGCSLSQTDNDVVPHFGAPMMKKFGLRNALPPADVLTDTPHSAMATPSLQANASQHCHS
jgi:hypothetical protein